MICSMLRFSSAEMPFLQTTSDSSEFICQQIKTTKKWTADMFTDGLQENHLRVSDASVRTSESAGNVGVIFDKTFDMSNYIKTVCRAEIHQGYSDIRLVREGYSCFH